MNLQDVDQVLAQAGINNPPNPPPPQNPGRNPLPPAPPQQTGASGPQVAAIVTRIVGDARQDILNALNQRPLNPVPPGPTPHPVPPLATPTPPAAAAAVANPNQPRQEPEQESMMSVPSAIVTFFLIVVGVFGGMWLYNHWPSSDPLADVRARIDRAALEQRLEALTSPKRTPEPPARPLVFTGQRIGQGTVSKPTGNTCTKPPGVPYKCDSHYTGWCVCS